MSASTNYSQANTTAPTTPVNYQFKAVLDSPAATVSSVSFAGGNSGSLTTDSLHHTFGYTSPGTYTSDTNTPGGLTYDYPNSSYTMTITGTPSNYAPVLNLSGTSAASYPSSIPALSNTNWQSGALVIDVTQNFNFTWNVFNSDSGLSVVNPQDIHLVIDGVSGNVLDQTIASSATSYNLLAGVLPSGTYTGRLVFGDYYTWDTGQISGAIGATVYANRTNFNIAAIPEPSTTALVFGFGMLAVALKKWRKRETHGKSARP